MTQQDRGDLRVLVLAPTGRDAKLISEMLSANKIDSATPRDVHQMAEEITRSAGVGVVAEEALVGANLEPLIAALSNQPPWSDFPLLFLTNSGTRPSGTSMHLLELLGVESNVTILERPVRVATLQSSVNSALRARRRQYQLRDFLRDRERHQEELLQTQKLESLGILAGGIAHDFNNLLTGILGNASLALECLPAECKDIADFLTDVVSASERAAHLTKQLLAYAGKGKFIIQPLSLSLMVNEVTHLVQSAVSKNAQLRLNLAADLPFIEGDAAQLQQIIMNLVMNAAEAIPADQNGLVHVTTSLVAVGQDDRVPNFSTGELQPGAYVLLEVKDDGEGMDEATLARIFDPFFTTKFTGRGLGLAAVLGIVKGHRGVLHVHTSEGGGSTFRVFFPPDESREIVPVEARLLPGAAPRAATVLVIDDEPVIRRTAETALKRYGFETVIAADGTEGLARFLQMRESIAVVLLDLTMPGMGGEEVFRRLRAIDPNLKIVLSSGFHETEVVPSFEGKGLAGFIQKPYSASSLIAAMRAVLEGTKETFIL